MSNFNNKDKNYLNRKTMRKNKRKENKQRKDTFFRNKNNFMTDRNNSLNKERVTELKSHNVIENCQKNFSNKNQKKTEKKKFIPEEDEDLSNLDDNDDEEINSEIASENENYSEEENLNENENAEEKIPGRDEIDDEIKALEKKLGLKEKKKYDIFKKKAASENYDHDLFDFLDNIKSIVKEKNVRTNPQSNLPEPSEKSSKKLGKKSVAIKSSKTPNEEEISTLPEKNSEVISETPQSRLFGNSKFTEEEKFKMKFQKEITSLFNKISEANINLMYPSLLEKLDQFEIENAKKIKLSQQDKFIFLYDTITKVSLRMNLDQEITNLPITSCICSYLSVLHYKYGNSFLIYFIKSLFERVDQFFSLKEGEDVKNIPLPKSIFKNFIFTIIHFYIFGNLNSKIFFEIIKHFIENFNEVYSEMLLILLSYVGIEIRKEDPESLKEIISNITKKYNLMKINTNNEAITGKIKYIVDMIEDIKNNKYMRFNLSEKFNFFKNFVNTNKKSFVSEKEYDLKSGKIADKIEISWQSIKNLDKNKIADFIQSSDDKPDGVKNLNVNDILFENELNDFDEFTVDSSILEKKLKKFKITTDLKKKIFISIVSSTDCNDAFERLNRLNLKKDQSREIVKIIVMLANEEKCYNPFYRMLLTKLISVEKGHKYTVHYTIWDHLKIMSKDTFSPKKLHNLSKLVAELLVDEKISLPVLLPFEFENANEFQNMFVVMVFDYYFQIVVNPDKCKMIFAKLVKNDDHVEFGRRLFTFFVKDYKIEVKVEEKSKEYVECYQSALKVLKRVL